MPRITDVLERESRTVDLEQGDFERLLGRRERKQRNRRIRAGALGVIVALAMGIVLVRSLTSDEVPANPPVDPRPAPAAAGTLAYELDGDIYIADQDGSNAVRIANGRSDERCGRGGDGETYGAEGSMWSPDGRYLAFRYSDCSDPESGGGVISDAEGNVLARFPRQGWEIAWSPDSTRVAVWDVTFETIGVYGLDGVRQAQVSMPPGWSPSGDHDPKWMPEGTSVWLEEWELPLDGSPPRRLPPHGGDPYATYSPDGSLVAYDDIGGLGLTVARADGSEPRRVVPGRVGLGADWGHPWSPTGDRIAFTTQVGGRADPMEVSVVEVATGSVTPLAEGEPGASLQAIGFSPEGDRILFSSVLFSKNGRMADSSLWSVGVDGADPRLVVAGTFEGEWL